MQKRAKIINRQPAIQLTDLRGGCLTPKKRGSIIEIKNAIHAFTTRAIKVTDILF